MPKKRKDADERSFLWIDLDRLDEEWQEQPDLFKSYHDQLSDAKKDLAVEEGELEVIRCEIARDIRSDPAAYDAEKLTEPAIKELIPLQKKYQRQASVVIESKHAVDVLTGTVKALEHRKKALENEVYLHGQDYFSTPRVRGEADKAQKEATKRSARKASTREQLDDDED